MADDAEPSAVDAYVARVKSIQTAAGIASPQVLPESMADAYAGMLVPDPKVPGKRAARLTQMEQAWGAHYGDVLRQVAPKLDGVGQIIPFVPARTAVRLDTLAADPKPVMEALQQSGKKSELEEAVTGQMEDLDRTMPAGVVMDGAAVSQQYREAVTLYAADLVRSGASPSKAAAQAAQEIIGTQYDLRDTLRIPRREEAGRGRPIDADAVENGTKATIRQLGAAGQFGIKPSANERPEDAQADMRDLVRREGFWITNGDETGAVLATPQGVVIGADGKPVTMTWAQLEAAAQLARERAMDPRDASGQAIYERALR